MRYAKANYGFNGESDDQPLDFGGDPISDKPTFGIEASNFEGMRTVRSSFYVMSFTFLIEFGLWNCLGLSVFKTCLVHSDSLFQIARKKSLVHNHHCGSSFTASNGCIGIPAGF